jgi:hypothetical protein
LELASIGAFLNPCRSVTTLLQKAAVSLAIVELALSSQLAIGGKW